MRAQTFFSRASLWAWVTPLTLLSSLSCGPGPLPAESPKTAPDERAPVLPILIEDGRSASSPEIAASSKTTEVPQLGFKDVGLLQPHSVVYEPTSDSYLVSNVGGELGKADNQAFISQLSPDGAVRALKFIDATTDGVELHSPVGLAVHENTLYVADMQQVRSFALDSQKPLANVTVGSEPLTDLAVSASGEVFITDANTVYRLVGGKAVKWLNTPDGQPRIAADGGSLWVADSRSLELRRYALADLPVAKGAQAKQAPSETLTLPSGGIQGVVAVDSDRIALTSADERALLLGAPNALAPFGPEGLSGTGDPGFDVKRGLLLIPISSTGEVRTIAVPGKPLTEPAEAGKLPASEPAP